MSIAVGKKTGEKNPDELDASHTFILLQSTAKQ